MATYYSRFIKNFPHIARPLHDISKKNAKFKWLDAHETAFQTLKQRLVSAPIMSYTQQKGMFILDTDASDKCYWACLSQLQLNERGIEEEKLKRMQIKRLRLEKLNIVLEEASDYLLLCS